MHPRYYSGYDHSRPPFSRGISYEEPPPRPDEYGFRSYPPPAFTSHRQERDGFHDNAYPPPYRNVAYPECDRYGNVGHEPSSRFGPPYGPSSGRRSPPPMYSSRPYEDQLYYRDHQAPPPPEMYSSREYRPAAPAYYVYDPAVRPFDNNRSPTRLYSFGNNLKRARGGKRVLARSAADSNTTDAITDSSTNNKPAAVIEAEPEEEKHDPAVEQMARSTLTYLNYRIAMSLLAFNLTIPALEMPSFSTTASSAKTPQISTEKSVGPIAVAKRAIDNLETGVTASATPKRQRSDDSVVSREGRICSAEKEARISSATNSVARRLDLPPPPPASQQRPPLPPGPPSRSMSNASEIAEFGTGGRIARDRSEESRQSQAQFHRHQPPPPFEQQRPSPPPMDMRNEGNSGMLHRSRSDVARYENPPPSLQRSSSGGLENPSPYDGRPVRAYSGGREGYEQRSRFSDHASHDPNIQKPQYHQRHPDDRPSPRGYPSLQGYDDRDRRGTSPRFGSGYEGYPQQQQPQDYQYSGGHRPPYDHPRHHEQPPSYGWERGAPAPQSVPPGCDGYRRGPPPLPNSNYPPQGGYNSSGYGTNPLRTPR